LEGCGHSFCATNVPPGELDFIIFPFKADIGISVYNDDFFATLNSSTLVFSGIRNAYVADRCAAHGLEYHVMMENNVVAAKNAVPTSEGVIAYIITNHINTLANSKVLVIGYGTCGSDLAKRLKALDADMYALVRNKEKEMLAWADSITPIYLDALFDHPFDIVINTVPQRVLHNEMLDKIQGAILIDIASEPYGFDMEYAKKLNEKSALLPGIPGKYAVRTAGEILGEYINCILCGR